MSKLESASTELLETEIGDEILRPKSITFTKRWEGAYRITELQNVRCFEIGMQTNPGAFLAEVVIPEIIRSGIGVIIKDLDGKHLGNDFQRFTAIAESKD